MEVGGASRGPGLLLERIARESGLVDVDDRLVLRDGVAEQEGALLPVGVLLRPEAFRNVVDPLGGPVLDAVLAVEALQGSDPDADGPDALDDLAPFGEGQMRPGLEYRRRKQVGAHVGWEGPIALVPLAELVQSAAALCELDERVGHRGRRKTQFLGDLHVRRVAVAEVDEGAVAEENYAHLVLLGEPAQRRLRQADRFTGSWLYTGTLGTLLLPGNSRLRG